MGVKIIKLKENPNDNWAQVELYRWQHGNLPGEEGTKEKPLDVAEGLRGMATALERADRDMPLPFNVASVLHYVAKLIEQFDRR